MRSFPHDHAPFPGRLFAACVMASRGGFRPEEDIVRLAGKKPEPALELRQRDVLSGKASRPIAEFASAMTSGQGRAETVLRPLWISPNEV